jgi:hypothetical protein
MRANMPTFQKPPASQSSGVSAKATTAALRPDADLWRQAIDEMLGWMSPAGDLDSQDLPQGEILATAIDYAVDQAIDPNGAPPPDSIIPTGSGRIAMEWNDGPRTVIVEFAGRGEAEYIEMRSGAMLDRRKLARNPKSRQLELRG